MQLVWDQERGGRKGGLPICEEILLLVRAGLRAALAGGKNAMAEKAAAMTLKQLSAQAAMHAPSSTDFCVLPSGVLWWWWSQSGIVGEAEISIAVVAPAAKPIAAGSVATDRATRAVKMVRPIRMNSLVSVRASTMNLRIQSLYGRQ
jgi:hypothetical protein